MKIQWESKNMGWGVFICLNWESFYFCFTLAGIDVEFHIHNLRKEIYKKPLDFTPTEDGKSRCLRCGYEPDEYEGLYRGYGCPRCESPLVVQISNQTTRVEE